jgi:hypothetical protein
LKQLSKLEDRSTEFNQPQIPAPPSTSSTIKQQLGDVESAKKSLGCLHVTHTLPGIFMSRMARPVLCFCPAATPFLTDSA